MSLEELRYPIGRFVAPARVSRAQVGAWIDEIERFPAVLGAAVRSLTPEQLETPYRLDGWCVRQVVHHVADSHLNSFIRFKWALTEDRPTIKPYFEDRWAELADYVDVPWSRWNGYRWTPSTWEGQDGRPSVISPEQQAHLTGDADGALATASAMDSYSSVRGSSWRRNPSLRACERPRRAVWLFDGTIVPLVLDSLDRPDP